MRIPLLVLTMASAIPAQAFIETFTYPDGPVIPLWTQQNFTWAIKSQRLVPTGGKNFHYITSDLFKNVADCVLDVDVFYPQVTSLHYGGVCARHPGGAGENGLVMTKLQDNSSVGSGAFDYIWLYERPGGAQAATVTPPTLAGTLRLIVKGTNSWQQLDGNMDGIFEVTPAVRPLIAATTQPSGLIGIDGYNMAEMDNFKFFDAVLIEDPTPGNVPQIGSTYRMTFSAPLNTAGVAPWVGMLALGKAGIQLGDGRKIPLSLDPLLVTTLGIGIGGLLTTTNPDGTIAIPIPNDPGLIGLDVFAGGFSLDGTRWLGIGAIANDHHFRIR